MNTLKFILFAVSLASFVLLLVPVRSMSIHDHSIDAPTRHKRWTFNTWRLHGRRQMPEIYSSLEAEPQQGRFLTKSGLRHIYESLNQDFGSPTQSHVPMMDIIQEFNRKYQSNK